MFKIFVVEDEDDYFIAIDFTLKEAGYEVIRASSVLEAKEIFAKKRFDLIILDILLPDGKGFDLCKYIREQSDIPIIFLTAEFSGEIHTVYGLEIGGDDYLEKSCGTKELLSRIKVLLRRCAKSNNLKSGELVIDRAKLEVYRNNELINLTPQEYRLLLIFLENPKKVLEKDDILRMLSKDEFPAYGDNTLSVYIKRLREKTSPKYILTKKGNGYIWTEDVVTRKIP